MVTWSFEYFTNFSFKGSVEVSRREVSSNFLADDKRYLREDSESMQLLMRPLSWKSLTSNLKRPSSMKRDISLKRDCFLPRLNEMLGQKASNFILMKP